MLDKPTTEGIIYNKTALLGIFVTIMAMATTATASELYLGKYIASTQRSRPDGGTAQYVSGVILDKQLGRFTPRVQIETLMDSYNGNGSFHPASVRYEVGISTAIYDGTYIDVSRSCWHPVDAAGSVEEYWLVKAGYRW